MLGPLPLHTTIQTNAHPILDLPLPPPPEPSETQQALFQELICQLYRLLSLFLRYIINLPNPAPVHMLNIKVNQIFPFIYFSGCINTPRWKISFQILPSYTLPKTNAKILWNFKGWKVDKRHEYVLAVPTWRSCQVQHLQSTSAAFAALRADGCVYAWGDENRGGDSSILARWICLDDYNATGSYNLIIWVVVSNIFYFHPYLGKWSNLTSIFFKWVETTN